MTAIPVTVKTYDANGKEEATSTIKWHCDQRSAAMLMTAAVYTAPARDLRISLDTVSSPMVYPRKVVGTQKLGDIHATIKLASGVLRMLGTRTKLSLTGRTAEALQQNGDLHGRAGPYRIRSNIVARISVLHIPVRRVRMKSEEWLDPQVGLLRYRLTFSGGRFTVIERLKSANSDGDGAASPAGSPATADPSHP